MSREDFEVIRAHAKKVRQERVAKNGARIEYALKQLENVGLEYKLCNESNGHIQVRRCSDDKLINFWAGTGKIQGYNNVRGIHNLIRICTQ